MLIPIKRAKCNFRDDLTVLIALQVVSSQSAAVATVLAAAVFSATLAVVHVHGLRDLRDPFHQGATEALFGIAFLLEVGVVGQHLLAFVDFQLGVELFQFILREANCGSI